MSSLKKPAVFNMNSTNAAVKTVKKAATLLKTEASGDKENLVERGHATLVLYSRCNIFSLFIIFCLVVHDHYSWYIVDCEIHS